MSNDLFDSQIDSRPMIDPAKDYLPELVGEGKRFQDVSALARSKVEADAFIESLKSELAGMRQELNTRMRLEEVVTKLTPSPAPVTPSIPMDTPLDEPNRTTQGLTAEAFEDLLNKKLSERELKAARDRNLESVKNDLNVAYGNDYVVKLKEKAQELGVTAEWINNLAAENPKALLKLIGAPAPQQRMDLFNPPPSQLQGSFTPSNQERNKAYYDKIKDADPKRYWSPDVQIQQHKDAVRLGERFFNT